MAFKSVLEIEKIADAKKKAVVAVDCGTYEQMVTVVKAAEQVGSPAILMYYPGGMSAVAFHAIAKDLAEHASVDIGITLDHGPDYETCMECIAAGFPSIMIDCSDRPFEENVRLTREVVRTAHLFGVDVEAELGHVGEASREQDYQDASRFAKPEEAVEFVKRTGVDSLAVHIGSAHGIYRSSPHLDLELLKKINAAIDVPLVLHGGSGIPFEQVREAIRLGINKTNYGTEFDRNFAQAVYEILRDRDGEHYTFEMAPQLYEKMMAYTTGLLRMAWDV